MISSFSSLPIAVLILSKKEYLYILKLKNILLKIIPQKAKIHREKILKFRKNSNSSLKTYLKFTFTLLLIALMLFSLNIRESEASFYRRIRKGRTLTYEITDYDDDLIKNFSITTVYDLEKGDRAYYKIYDIKKTNGRYIFRYRAWDWTDDDNNFYQKYDRRSKIKTSKDPYYQGWPARPIDRIHNNTEFIMSIILDNVDDYLSEVNWKPNVIQYGYCYIIIEGNYNVYHQYSKYGYISEYSIIKGEDIIFRARYDGELESPTNNELFFDLLPFIITTLGIIGITLIFGSILKKKDIKKKFNIDQILEKEERLKNKNKNEDF